LARSRRIWKGLRSKSDLLLVKVEGIPVGDLVNDSFLRFKPSATLDIKDSYLWLVLWQACRDVRRAKLYFESVRPKLFLASYSTYVQHGIAVRVALSNDTAVFSFGNYQEFAKRLSMGDWLHTKNPDQYAAKFELLDDREAKIASADIALSRRMMGEIDVATSYMKASAYSETTKDVPDVNDAVVIFLHDFYDSPHVYHDMVFSDFWEWICFTLDTLMETGVRFFVKPHPNQIALSSAIIPELQLRYPALTIIPQAVTNRQLARAGMRWAVTVYGTVAHEMAYLGIPTIACARHPHVSFGFCVTARSRAEYREALRGVIVRPAFDRAKAKDESLRFFHMHNRDLSAEAMELRDAAHALLKDCGQSKAQGKAIIGDLQRLSETKGFRDFVTGCVEIINGN
jgi:hypothetical protein